MRTIGISSIGTRGLLTHELSSSGKVVAMGYIRHSSGEHICAHFRHVHIHIHVNIYYID